MLPSTPAPFGPGTPSGLVTAAEWTQFQAQLDAHNDQRDAMFKSHHKLQQLAGRALFCLHRGDLAQVAELHATFAQIARAAIDAAQGRVEIRSIIDGSMESFVSGAVFVHFLAHGRVPAKAAIPLPVTSTEYLSGVCGFVQELQRYAAARAIQRDVRSVLLCRDVVEAVNARMMQFDFRNSPLRRKYDGIKYTVKRLQDILYELSLTDFEEAKCLSADPRPPADADTMTDAEDFEALRKETEEYDATRDAIIKRSRDVTKAAKNAIYALHRSDHAKAEQLLAEAEKAAQELLPLVAADRTLRFGSFAGGLEEYAEARAFQYFLKTGGIMPLAEMPVLELPEYLGGLADLTGELGRYAVAKATVRDVEAVERCHAIMDALSGELLMLRLGGDLYKKTNSIGWNLKKAETLLYDLMLATGGRQGGRTEDAPMPSKGDEGEA